MSFRRLLVTALLILVSAPAADAMTGRDLILTLGGGLGYVLPLDTVPNATAAYGLRLLRRAYTGPAINCRRVSDNAQKDIGFTRRGDLDVATLTAWLGGSTCAVTKWYDQSGHGNDLSQATAANQPTLALAIQNGRPALQGNGSQSLSTSASMTVQTPGTVAWTAIRTAAFTSFNRVAIFGSGATAELSWNQSANTGLFFDGTLLTFSLADNAWHIAQGTYNGASSSIRVDGATTSSLNPGSNALTGIFSLMGPGSGLNGYMEEAYAWPKALSTAEQAALDASVRGYMGF